MFAVSEMKRWLLIIFLLSLKRKVIPVFEWKSRGCVCNSCGKRKCEPVALESEEANT